MDSSTVQASRLLFGLSAMFHYLFVPLTIGLVTFIAMLEGLALAGRGAHYQRVARFLAWPFAINFACGMLTGYPLRAQLESQWSTFLRFAQPVFDPVFQLEAAIAPWLLSLVLLFLFGWRLRPAWHFAVSVALALCLLVQSCAILLINAWMQLPVPPAPPVPLAGASVAGGLLQLASNPMYLPKAAHTVFAAWLLGGTFVVAVAAAFVLRRIDVQAWTATLKAAGRFTLAAALATAIAGHASGQSLAHHQPMKFAAIEALWETSAEPELVLFGWPDTHTWTTRFKLAVPSALAWVAEPPGGTFAGLRELAQAAQEAPPNVPLVFWSFRVMVGSWLLIVAAALLAALGTLDTRARCRLRWCVASAPLAWIATEAGWLACEAGRQPWIVTGRLLTSQGHAQLPDLVTRGELLAWGASALMLLALNIAAHALLLSRGLHAVAPVNAFIARRKARHAPERGEC